MKGQHKGGASRVAVAEDLEIAMEGVPYCDERGGSRRCYNDQDEVGSELTELQPEPASDGAAPLRGRLRPGWRPGAGDPPAGVMPKPKKKRRSDHGSSL